MRIENLQRLVRPDLIIVAAVHAHALAGQRHGIHIVKITLRQTAGKIDDVAQCQVGADILRKNLCIFRDLRDGDRLNALLGKCLQERLLHLGAADIGCSIAGTVAAKLNGVRAVERLPALLQVDIEILRRVVIVHVHRNFHINAADHIDNLLKGLQIDQHIAVHPDAEGLADLVLQRADSLLAHTGRAVDGVNLGQIIITIDIGVARDTQKRDFIRAGVQVCDDDGVRAAAVAVRAADKNIEHTVVRVLDGLAVVILRDGRGAAGAGIDIHASVVIAVVIRGCDRRAAVKHGQAHHDRAEENADGKRQQNRALCMAAHAAGFFRRTTLRLTGIRILCRPVRDVIMAFAAAVSE